MKIGVAGPMTLEVLDFGFGNKNNVPRGYDFPMVSFLINGISKRGHRVVAYTSSKGIEKPIVYEGKHLTICIGRRRICRSARDLFRFERKDLSNLMLTYPVDIINAQWTYEFAWAAISTGIPSIVTLQDHAMTILRYETDPYRFMRLIMNHIVLKKARHLSANSQYLYNLLSDRVKKKTRIIPNFYSRIFEEYASMHAKKSNFVLSVSNGFGRRKNIDTALKAFSILKRSCPGIEYHLVGNDMQVGGPAFRYAIENNLSTGVCFLGKLPYDEVIDKIKRALILVHPSREESFGMVVLEAMVVGTPVLGGKESGNIPYLLDHGNAGTLCDVESPRDIAKGLLANLENAPSSSRLAKNARRFAKTHFSEDVIVEAYLTFYREIINGTSARQD